MMMMTLMILKFDVVAFKNTQESRAFQLVYQVFSEQVWGPSCPNVVCSRRLS